MRIGKVAVESKFQVARNVVYGVMQIFDRSGSGRDRLKCRVELCEVVDFNRDMKFTELSRTQSEFSSRDSMAANSIGGTQLPQVTIHVLAKFDIRRTGTEIAPDVIDVHD
jgi:hypothetical protein